MPPDRAPGGRILRGIDLFAGSGCVGVAVLKHVPSAHVDFGEKEARHLTTIEKNIRMNGIDPSRTRVFSTDVWNAAQSSYDFVLANPPYLSRARLDRVQQSVLEHEPPEALFSDDDGFELIKRTIEGLPRHLDRGGQCWIEHEPEHSKRILWTAESLGLTASAHEDQYGVQRYSVILHSC